MRSSKKIDMTQGSIIKLAFVFALPLCLGNILQQLYNTVDTLIIGNFCSSVSLAAVGTSSQPVELLLSIFMGLGTGVSILVSQHMGSGNTSRLRIVLETATSFLYICAIPLSVLGFFAGPFILKLMQVPDDAFSLSVTYIRIIFMGTLGNMGYNMNAGILRGVGDSRSSLFFLIISCIVNIVLDLLFIVVFKMDVAGAALATVFAMYCSWVFSIIYIRKKYPELQFHVLPRRPDKSVFRSITEIGLPLGMNNSLYSVGHVLMQSLINSQGSSFVAACAVATKLTGIAHVTITALASAATTFSGQNLGAGNYQRLKKGALRIPLFSAAFTFTIGLIVVLFCRPILTLFTKDPAVLKLAAQYIYIVLPFTWAYAMLSSIINFVNGMGIVKYPTIINLLMLFAVRIPAAYLIANFINGQYVMASIPISFLFGMTAMLMFFLTKQWRRICRRASEKTC